MSIARSVASLRITTRTLSPAELAEAVGAPPTYLREKGQPLTDEIPDGRTYESTVWMLRAGLSGYRSMSEQVDWLAGRIAERREAMARLRDQATLDVYCVCEQLGDGGRVTFSPEAMRLFGDLGVAIVLDIYSVGDAEL